MPPRLRVEHTWITNLIFSAVLVFTPGAAWLSLAAPGPGATEPKQGATVVNYGRPFEPLTRPALLALPAGAIEPQGWLRDWCLDGPGRIHRAHG